MSRKIRFVVTGATGFIGQALCSELSRLGFITVAYGRKSNFKTGPGIAYSCVKSYLEVKGDPDSVCVHLAGESSISSAENRLTATLADAVLLARHICAQPFGGVIFASSAAVYGDRSEIPRREDAPLDILGDYARIKHAVEGVLLERDQIVARIANAYGPGMSKSNVLSDIVSQMENSGPVKVKCSMPVRDFIHVSDVIRGLISMATGTERGVFNLGTGTGTSIAGLAKQILDLAGQTDRDICCSDREHIHSSIVLDPSKMKMSYGWSARLGLRDGLKELMDSLRNLNHSCFRGRK
jgi:UDP-glucose 4-epimerase